MRTFPLIEQILSEKVSGEVLIWAISRMWSRMQNYPSLLLAADQKLIMMEPVPRTGSPGLQEQLNLQQDRL